MKKILIFTSKDGHFSISEASKDYLQSKNKIKASLVIPKEGARLYTYIYQYFPYLFKIPYKLGEKERVFKTTYVLFQRWLENRVKREVKSFAPDLIISTYLLANPAIEKVLDYQKSSIPFINVIANPWSIHRLELSPHAISHLAYDQKTINIVQKKKMPTTNIVPTGWLTRKSFYQKHDKSKTLKHFGFNEKTLTFLICGGSEGTNSIVKILPALLLTQIPLQVIEVCGNKKDLYKRLKTLNNAYQKFCQSNRKIINKIKINKNTKLKLLRFEKNLASLIQASDLVIGKAGPNLLFETIACQKPFMAISHISGQEDGNLEIIEKKGLGFVEESPIKAIKLLQKIIQNPQILKNLKNNIEKEFHYNKQAGALPLLLLIDNQLSRVEGLLLLMIYGVYNYTVLWGKRKDRSLGGSKSVRKFLHRLNHKGSPKQLAWVFMGAALLLFSADMLVKIATQLAKKWLELK